MKTRSLENKTVYLETNFKNLSKCWSIDHIVDDHMVSVNSSLIKYGFQIPCHFEILFKTIPNQLKWYRKLNQVISTAKSAYKKCSLINEMAGSFTKFNTKCVFHSCHLTRLCVDALSFSNKSIDIVSCFSNSQYYFYFIW